MNYLYHFWRKQWYAVDNLSSGGDMHGTPRVAAVLDGVMGNFLIIALF
jgi:hypothetical protein